MKKYGLVVLFAALCLAPTPGDVGGCGQQAQPLDAPIFFATKKAIDCQQCRDCGFVSDTCAEACDGNADFARSFPDGCLPLVHDGAVCLRRLSHASCGEYEAFVDDDAPTTPTECNFCPPR